MQVDAKRTVLLVEDHAREREVIRRILVDNDFNVETTPDYHGAVRYLSKFVPNLVCLDLTLPRESGFELCEYVRKDARFRFVPVLVVSDRSSPEDMAQAEYVGANAFLKKPFSGPKLLKYVTTLLDGPHASRPSVRRLRRSDMP
jgi:DNA-binding response OmpR family regulator